MAQMDEELLRRREMREEFERERFSKETVEKEKTQSIFDGTILINMVPVTFTERTFLEDKVAIWMPRILQSCLHERLQCHTHLAISQIKCMQIAVLTLRQVIPTHSMKCLRNI